MDYIPTVGPLVQGHGWAETAEAALVEFNRFCPNYEARSLGVAADPQASAVCGGALQEFDSVATGGR